MTGIPLLSSFYLSNSIHSSLNQQSGSLFWVHTLASFDGMPSNSHFSSIFSSSSPVAQSPIFLAVAPKFHFWRFPAKLQTHSTFITNRILFNMFHFALKQFIQSSKLKHAGRFLDKICGLDCVDLIEHGVIVDWQFFINTEKKVIWHI